MVLHAGCSTLIDAGRKAVMAGTGHLLVRSVSYAMTSAAVAAAETRGRQSGQSLIDIGYTNGATANFSVHGEEHSEFGF